MATLRTIATNNTVTMTLGGEAGTLTVTGVPQNVNNGSTGSVYERKRNATSSGGSQRVNPTFEFSLAGGAPVDLYALQFSLRMYHYLPSGTAYSQSQMSVKVAGAWQSYGALYQVMSSSYGTLSYAGLVKNVTDVKIFLYVGGQGVNTSAYVIGGCRYAKAEIRDSGFRYKESMVAGDAIPTRIDSPVKLRNSTETVGLCTCPVGNALATQVRVRTSGGTVSLMKTA